MYRAYLEIMQVLIVTYLVYCMILFWIVDTLGDFVNYTTGNDENMVYSVAWHIMQYVGYTEQYALYDRFGYPLPEYYKVV